MPLLVCAGLFCVWGMARNNMRNNIKAKSTLFRQADFVPHWASKFGGSCAKFTKYMVDFLHFTQANSVMLMSKAQIFEKAVQNISLNRLIHRKTWDTTENSLEKARISAKTRWENVQGRKTGRSCNSYTIMRVFFTSVHKKWVRPHYVGIPICDDQTMQRSQRHFRSEHSFLLPGCANGVHW